MPTQTYRSRPTPNLPTGVVLHTGDYANRAAGLVFCAANGIALPHVDLRNDVLNDADLSGLQAPCADLTNASCRRVIANRLVNGKPLELSAALLQGCVWDDAILTHANLACTHPTSLKRVKLDSAQIRGVDWVDCPDVVVLPVKDDAVGKVIVFFDGSAVKVHAGARGVLAEAAAQAALEALPDSTQAQRYRDAFTWLNSPAGAATKTAALAIALVVANGNQVTHLGERVYVEVAE